MDKFIDTIELSDWEVETDTGWADIKAIGKTREFEEYLLNTANHTLLGADTHIIMGDNMNQVYMRDLKEGDVVHTVSGLESVVNIIPTGNFIHMYDLQLGDTNHRYYTDGVLSHNSIWLANLALNMMTAGYNVLVISLEMATYKIYRRMGSNAFRIPMNEYGEFANKRPTVEQKMNEFRNINSQGGVMPVGTLRTRRYSRATAMTIESFARDLEDKLGIKWHAIVIDYLNEMENAYGITSEKMYNFHKENTNDLYCMAGDNQWSVITAFQLKVAKMQDGDFSLGDLGESSGVTHRPDNIFGIIQSPDMKVNNEYLLKYLKARDSEYKEYKIPFTIDYRYMVLAEKGDQMIAPQAMGIF